MELLSLVMKSGGSRSIYYLKNPIELFGVRVSTICGSLSYKVLTFNSESERLKKLNYVRDYFRVEGFRDECFVGKSILKDKEVKIL